MRYLRLITVAAASCVFAAGSLRAQTTGQGLMNFGGTSGGVYLFADQNHNQFSEYVSPYSARFNVTRTPGHSDLLPLNVGTGTFGPPYDVFCVDMRNNIYFNQSNVDSWFTNLGSDREAVGQYTRSHNLQDYWAAAYLASQFAGADAQHRAYLSGAIWNVMSGAQYISYAWDPVANAWLDLNVNYVAPARAAVAQGFADAEYWVVVTPKSDIVGGYGVPVGGVQEQMVHVTPEPVTLLLLGSGMIGVLGAARRRKQRNA